MQVEVTGSIVPLQERVCSVQRRVVEEVVVDVVEVAVASPLQPTDVIAKAKVSVTNMKLN